MCILQCSSKQTNCSLFDFQQYFSFNIPFETTYCIYLQTSYRDKYPTIAKGHGNDGLLSDLTRLLGDEDREDYGRGFPSNIPKANPYGSKPIHSTDQHYHKAPQQYQRPYTEDPALYSNAIKPPLIQAHHNPSPYHKSNNNLGNFLENSIGGAFYDREHDLVVSYKVRCVLYKTMCSQ